MLLTAVVAATAPALATAEDCDALYYGIGASPAPAQAYACYGAQGDFPMQIVMVMNGEGTPADPAKAAALFTAWAKQDLPGATTGMQAEALQSALAARRAGKSFGRLDFCKDVAGDTRAVDRCLGVQARLADAKGRDEHAKLRASLAPAAAAALDKLQGAFQEFKAADGHRMYQQYIEGSIRNVAAMNQEAFVSKGYAALLGAVTSGHPLPPAADEAYRAADAELTRAGLRHVATFASYYERLLADEQLKEQWPVMRGYIGAYTAATETAALAWRRYREAWASFYETFAGAKSAAVVTALTRRRLEELEYDPAGAP